VLFHFPRTRFLHLPLMSYHLLPTLIADP
jgi:hypothetical protein